MYFESLSLSRTKGRMEVNNLTVKMHNWCERPCGWGPVLLCERRPALKNVWANPQNNQRKWDKNQCGVIAAHQAGTETLQVGHEHKERLCRCLEQTSSEMHSRFHQSLSAMSLSIHPLCWEVGLGNVVVGKGMCCFLTAHPWSTPTLHGGTPRKRELLVLLNFHPLAVQPWVLSGLGVSFGVGTEKSPATFQIFSVYSLFWFRMN